MSIIIIFDIINIILLFIYQNFLEFIKYGIIQQPTYLYLRYNRTINKKPIIIHINQNPRITLILKNCFLPK